MFRVRIPGAVACGSVAACVAVSVAAAFAPVVFAQGAAPAKPAPVDAKKGAQIAQEVCAACHGADGNSPTPANPKLAAQHPEYLAKQLSDFKPAEGEQQAHRPSAIMAGFAAMLSPEDARNVAAHFASQALTPAVATDAALAEAGRAIYRVGIAAKGVPACAGCHSPDGAGIPSQYPRLQGQFAEYAETQLTLFRSGERANSEQMRTIAERLSDREIKAVAQYMAGLR
ncbi:MAG: c-type cytochrome [Burkholderiaceae bacterium]|jgi:cbb3-type cytochrome c oxidase subunit III|nr:c-type cytochrome [Burkholderiaceae bacterium]